MTVVASCLLTLSLIIASIKLCELFPHELSTKNVESAKSESSYSLDTNKESFASEIKRNKSLAEAIEKDDTIYNQRAHISDFTNPRTGLNPFLDLIEGTYTGSSRQGATIPEKPTRVPKFESRTHPSYSLPSYHQWPPDIVEGESNPRQKLAVDAGKSLIEDSSSNGRIHVFPTNLFPFRDVESTTTKLPRMQKPSKLLPTRKCEPSKPLPITSEDNLNVDLVTTSAPNNNKEIVTTREKNLSNNSNRNFTIGITILGIAVIFFTIMLATCLWKQRTKRVPRHATLRNIVNNEPVRGRSMH
ncbi:uncharacterized protein LOC111628527 [Centruroides sculpturatus]|uniref:uncharacterized protein LOC111628527 n=1 Tax=Centruroides sculpturatus TaxID=218467 RepID=UPI000C6DC7F8|nr:uncharacterized protein LOC111628527 [Centruroides sculpturatus]